MPLKGETIVTTKSPALSVRIETDIKAAFILAKPANLLTGSLLPIARIGVSPFASYTMLIQHTHWLARSRTQ
jgi:hypothetical protein